MRSLEGLSYTVEPLYSGHALWRTSLYSGHLFQEQIISSYGQTFTFRNSLQKTPPYSGHLFREPMVSAIERFHCIFFILLDFQSFEGISCAVGRVKA